MTGLSDHAAERSVTNGCGKDTDQKLYAKGKFKVRGELVKYIYDVAFQAHVLKCALPGTSVTSFLMLADKSARTSVDRLNQLFFLDESSGRTIVRVRDGITPEMIGRKILCEVDVSEAVSAIHNDKDEGRPVVDHFENLPYPEEIAAFAAKYVKDEKAKAIPGSQCKKCQFRGTPSQGKRSGFEECWVSEANISAKEVGIPFVFDLWDFRRSDKMIDKKTFFMRDLTQEEVGVAPDDEDPGLSRTERQWLQVSYASGRRSHPFVDVPGLKAAMGAWAFPLHFIDFETAMVAIPFSKDCRPYQMLAFQFSHHVVHSDGRVEHTDQYLNDAMGFPNFDFVRRLKKSLISDSGTIFRYAHHENTVLCQIFEQLKNSSEPDRTELMTWIQTVTKSGKNSSETWSGPRQMVDLCELVKRFYYHPSMNGSNSIKKVLPAVLADSPDLQSRYGRPTYGSGGGAKSLNFKDWTWVRTEAGRVLDPYKLLPKVYKDVDDSTLDAVMCDDELADGGAAMTAYAMMQFTEMKESERRALREALLKYCELDTLAMVMLYEYWREFVEGKRAPIAA